MIRFHRVSNLKKSVNVKCIRGNRVDALLLAGTVGNQLLNFFAEFRSNLNENPDSPSKKCSCEVLSREPGGCSASRGDGCRHLFFKFYFDRILKNNYLKFTCYFFLFSLCSKNNCSRRKNLVSSTNNNFT